MKITESTKINDLIEEYPFVIDTLMKLNPKLKRLRNPFLRKTVGRRATLTDVSQMSGSTISQLVQAIATSIEKNTTEKVQVEISEQAKSGWQSERARRQEMLKALILELHEGGELDDLQKRFNELLGDVDASEIAAMEQALIDEGSLTAEQITKLCDLHVGIFEYSLDQHTRPETLPGHPIHTYMQENQVARTLISEIRQTSNPETIKKLQEIEIHYTRLENQLFPKLEHAGFTGPSQVMWAKHDEVRELFRQEELNIKELITQIEDLIFKEETILFPTALDLLGSKEWAGVRNGEEEIGYAWVTPGSEWVPITPETIHKTDITGHDLLQLRTGQLNLSQVSLLLTHLPIEISYIDENDTVRFYSDTPERTFPRSPGVIGRKVQNCHPKKSVHIVNRILDAFKSGQKDSAEFWIKSNDRFIHIRYFAVRDKDKNYRGTLEVTQDVTTIRELEGEQRLLSWQD
ncbi:MAG: DUF438 domain-containing protein [Candidatus Heimdallarchaeota archaeon]|nr:MAG: DUF438 domain-containing protein [Candidatus Heimdallarchaeota archaeon]